MKMKRSLTINEVLKRVEKKPELLKHLPEPYRIYIQALQRQKRGCVADPMGGGRKASPSP